MYECNCKECIKFEPIFHLEIVLSLIILVIMEIVFRLGIVYNENQSRHGKYSKFSSVIIRSYLHEQLRDLTSNAT